MESTGNEEKDTTREFVGRTGLKFNIVVFQEDEKEYALITHGLVSMGDASEFPCAAKYIEDNDVLREHLEGEDRMPVYCVPVEYVRVDCPEKTSSSQTSSQSQPEKDK